MEVVVRDGNIEKALRKLKKKMQEEGILQEVRARQGFEKPSVKKRRQHKESIRRGKKETAKRLASS